MAENDSTQKRQLSDDDLRLIGDDLAMAGQLMYQVIGLTRQGGSDDQDEADALLAAIRALCEKAGFLIDRCADPLPSCGLPICGSFEAWAVLDRPAVEAAAEAQVTA